MVITKYEDVTLKYSEENSVFEEVSYWYLFIFSWALI